jgi:hypothetical protein
LQFAAVSQVAIEGTTDLRCPDVGHSRERRRRCGRA